MVAHHLTMPSPIPPATVSVGAGEEVTVVSDHGDGWVDAMKADGMRGLVPKNYLNFEG